MRRFRMILVAALCLLLLAGCSKENESLEGYRLFVNGQEIPNTHGLSANWEAGYAELPLLAIAEAMDAQISTEPIPKQITEDHEVIPVFPSEFITITYRDYSLVLDTSKQDFGLPEPAWMDNAIRRAKDGEVFLDSRSVVPLFYHGWMTDITVDYQENVVYVSTLEQDVFSYPPEELDKVNCRLIVNGVDITEGNYVYINHEEKNAELPVTAIVKALGGSVQWYPCEPYPIKDRCIVALTLNGSTKTYDTSKSDFGIGYLEGVSGLTRKVLGSEIVIDRETIYTSFYHLFNTTIVIDFDQSTVYVDSFNPMDAQ